MKKQYIIPLFLTLLAACSSNEPLPTADDAAPEETTAVGFSASIQGSSSSRTDDEDEDYLHNHFIYETGENGKKSRIRVINTINYSIPDFETEGAYKEYEYNNEKGTWDDPVVNFIPYNNEEGFDWDELRPTAAAFVFEAACYPMEYTYFSKVATNQTKQADFWKADLLLAHHAQPLSERGELIKLKFHHVFAMVRIHIELPISGAYQKGGFPADAINSAELVDMLTGYTVDYTSAIANDGLRTVQATGERSNIQMFCKESQINDEGSSRSQSYLYCGIVPVQDIRGKTLVRFNITTYTGQMDSTGHYSTKNTDYIYVADNNISFSQEHITDLTLSVDQEQQTTILLNATVTPWGDTWTEMPMEPDRSSDTEENPESDSSTTLTEE